MQQKTTFWKTTEGDGSSVPPPVRESASLVDFPAGTVLVVSFEPAEALAQFARAFPSEFRFLSDPRHDLYGLYGLKVGGWRDILSPQTIGFYLRATLRGEYRAGQRGVDKKQLGGDFVIDAAGKIALSRASTSPADRVDVVEVEQVVRGLV